MITSETFGKAIEFAVVSHKGQTRKGDGRPYILHPFSVLWRLYNIKKSENMYLLGTAAVLHDTVEDCDVAIEEIARLFGYHVAALVQELTLDKSQYEKLGKKEYLAQELRKMSSYALAIKLCDRLDNVSDLATMSPTFVKNYKEETEYILDAIKDRKLTKTHKKLIRLIQKQIK